MEELKLAADECLPLRDVVFKTLRQAIINGTLSPGERLMEISLANQLGVSRTPVREAIRMLELEGLVIMVPRKGARVASITEKSLRDVIEVRSNLEQFGVSLACERITEEGKRDLQHAHQEFIEAIELGDSTIIVEKDESFHDAIFRATNNEKLVSTINNLREQFYRYRMEYVKDVYLRSNLVEEHEKLVNSILNNDTQTAIDIMRQHLENQLAAVISSIN